MSKVYADIISDKNTPQTQPLFGKLMVKNNAGGFTFEVDDWTRLTRFLVLGSEGGTYYTTERPLTIDNAKAVLRCIEKDGKRVVREVVDVSTKGRAPKQDAAIFVLALAAAKGDAATKTDAYAAVNTVCRTGTALFKFVANSNALRGWGKGLRKAISNWYLQKTPDQLAYQVTKYQQRDGWSHRDVLRLAHTQTFDLDKNAVLRWCVGGLEVGGYERTVTRKGREPVTYPAVGELPTMITAIEVAKTIKSKQGIIELIEKFGLVREHIPTQWLNEPDVWDALLNKMPLTALIRNLGNLTKSGVVAPLSNGALKVLSALGNKDNLKKARVHPLTILTAMKVYASGKGIKGNSTWTPVQSIIDALDAAFYDSFDFVRPTNKKWLIGLDVSGSMGSSLSNSCLTCAEASTAMALVLSRTEQQVYIGAFSTSFVPVSFGKKTRLEDALKQTRGMTFGETDCAQPMLHAQKNKMDVDAFIVLTDNESWYGGVHPCVALKQYRQSSGNPAKSIVVGMTSSGFTIADPTDGGMLDVVGFDTAVPDLVANFVGRSEDSIIEDNEE